MRARENRIARAALDTRTTHAAVASIEARRRPLVPGAGLVLGRLPVRRGWHLRRRLRRRRSLVRCRGHAGLLRLWSRLCRLRNAHSQPQASAAGRAASAATAFWPADEPMPTLATFAAFAAVALAPTFAASSAPATAASSTSRVLAAFTVPAPIPAGLTSATIATSADCRPLTAAAFASPAVPTSSS